MKLRARYTALIAVLLTGLLALPYLAGSPGVPAWQAAAQDHPAVTLTASHTATATWTTTAVATNTATPTFTATLTPVATGTATPTLTPTRTATPISGPSVVVEIRDFSFFPQTILIVPGTTVVWFNKGSQPHTATSDTGLWNTGHLATGQSGFHNFTAAGVFFYHCSYHPAMTGKIVVSPSIRRTYLPAIFKRSTTPTDQGE